MSWKTHDSCPECGCERMTGSMYVTAGSSSAKTGSCLNCGNTYVTDT